MISDKAKGLSGSTHVAHTQKLIDESTERYHHSCLAAGLTIKKTGKIQDIGHVDFVVNGETVDLKGLKNSSREGNNPKKNAIKHQTDFSGFQGSRVIRPMTKLVVR